MDIRKAALQIDHFWDVEIVSPMTEYIAIPNESPLFDPDWKAHGHMDRAVQLVYQWVKSQNIPGSRLQIIEEPGRTPVLLLEVAGESDGTILLYGHLDKQPPMVGWEPGLGPWKPVMRDGKLYGRGGADDGYAIFAIVSAIQVLKEQGISHPNLVALIECCEESGSVDLPHYVEKLADQIGTPGLIICLDSGCGNYEQLWTTTSLRGMTAGDLTVEILREGVHSGDASGIVPSSFRIARLLLERLEDSLTGQLRPEWLYVDIPDYRVEDARRSAEVLGTAVYDKFPFVDGASPVSHDLTELILNRTWRPTLSVTGQSGMPDLSRAGNVLRPHTALKLSLRLPPTLRVEGLSEKLKALLETDVPYGARVTFNAEKAATGWEAPALQPWLAQSLEKGSTGFFGKSACTIGEGGSIPFMGMLGDKFPQAQFMITGVLGPHSNAHGPNEFLHIQTAKNITGCVAQVIADVGLASSH